MISHQNCLGILMDLVWGQPIFQTNPHASAHTETTRNQAVSAQSHLKFRIRLAYFVPYQPQPTSIRPKFQVLTRNGRMSSVMFTVLAIKKVHLQSKQIKLNQCQTKKKSMYVCMCMYIHYITLHDMT
jgi:hypothetical protein